MRQASRTLSGATLLALIAGLLLTAATPPAGARTELAGQGAGILRADTTSDLTTLDPALVQTTPDWQVQFLTGARLLSVPDKEGAAGMRIIPEVARSLPAISRDGKTYTFTLKKTYRFSDGSAVTAQNFRDAFDRIASPMINSRGAFFIRDVVGVHAVSAGRASHISGITVLGKYKIRFRLNRVAGDFPARLTMPYFSAVPDGMPVDGRAINAPFPAAGPYYVLSWARQSPTATLVRNPLYDPKDKRAQNSAEIHLNFRISLGAQRLRVENGQTDVASIPASPVAEELAAKYGINQGRFFVKGQAVFWYLNFNHDQPLFKGNDKLRRAVNHAIDRPQMVRQHGALGGSRTDQILPIDFPGFRNWNLYPLGGPNLTRANQLARGNTRSGKARFWTFNTGSGLSVAQVVKFNLSQIGIDATITALDPVEFYRKAGTRATNDYDLLLNVWGAEYPDPYNFINILLQGTSIHAENTANLSYFNSPVWNKRMMAASNQFGAQRLRTYASLDRDLMKGPAPVAPYININARILVSDRVKNFIFHKVYGTDFATITVQ